MLPSSARTRSSTASRRRWCVAYFVVILRHFVIFFLLQCYYFEPIKKLVSRPFSIGMPALKVCQKLRKNNPEICEVKYREYCDSDLTLFHMHFFVTAPKIDLNTVNFKKMRVKQLKGILADEGISCDGCTEKEDYVKKVKKLAAKQAKAEEKRTGL